MPRKRKNPPPPNTGTISRSKRRQAQEECFVCTDMVPVSQLNSMQRRCCQFRLCCACFSTYLHSKLYDGIVRIQCPGDRCHAQISDREVISNLANNESRKLFRKLRTDARNDPTCKTCPRCGQEFRVRKEDLHTKDVAEFGLPVGCDECALQWCFTCHAPWHEGVTCQNYRQGDKAFKKWTRMLDAVRGVNAQKCPFCEIYIQRISGCNSMVCKQCGTRFCYDCGQELDRDNANVFYRLILGSHGDRWSLLGCPGLIFPQYSALRATVRTLVVVGKLLIPFVLLLVGIIAAVVLPVLWLTYMGAKKCVLLWRKLWTARINPGPESPSATAHRDREKAIARPKHPKK